jgi:polyphosphate kinase 2 (PPK2 family)
MFETAELGRTVSRQKYDSSVLSKLHAGLLGAQLALKEKKIPVIIVVSGADGAGKGEFVHRLNQWLEPRGVETHAFWQYSDEERERPRFWRFWRALPAWGRIGILFGSWYSEPMEQLRRFKERQNSPLKRYKITEEDWRNRKQWAAYKEAVNEMVARTSTEFAPWTVVAGDDKKFARVQILKTLCQRLEQA